MGLIIAEYPKNVFTSKQVNWYYNGPIQSIWIQGHTVSGIDYSRIYIWF